MLREMCKSKIHRATVTQTELSYEGSITIDTDLMEATDILPGEKVQVVNINNGHRSETYAIEGERGSGIICLNGAAARWAEPGDLIIVMCYALVDDAEIARGFKTRIVLVDGDNAITKSP